VTSFAAGCGHTNKRPHPAIHPYIYISSYPSTPTPQPLTHVVALFPGCWALGSGFWVVEWFWLRLGLR